jgi:hypothetical protein
MLIINELPRWIPFFNIGSSLVAVLLSLLLLYKSESKFDKLMSLVFLVASLILIAGALFQGNLLALWLWEIIGSGGRVVFVVLLLIAGHFTHNMS